MKVTEVTQVTSEIVSVDEGEWQEYMRHGPDNWEVRMGESWEPVYNCAEMEKAYQEYQKGSVLACYNPDCKFYGERTRSRYIKCPGCGEDLVAVDYWRSKTKMKICGCGYHTDFFRNICGKCGGYNPNP